MDRFQVILCHPRHPGNVGACARVAANFEAGGVRVVADDPARFACLTGEDAATFATGSARERLLETRRFSTLREALSDCAHSVGFTRRGGAERKPSLRLAEVADLDGRVALVFGNEEFGLSAEELELCTEVCTIPTGDSLPSMNLSHAVAVALSRIFDTRSAFERKEAASAGLGELNELLDRWNEAIDALELGDGGARMRAGIRRFLTRNRPESADLGALRTFLAKASARLQK